MSTWQVDMGCKNQEHIIKLIDSINNLIYTYYMQERKNIRPDIRREREWDTTLNALRDFSRREDLSPKMIKEIQIAIARATAETSDGSLLSQGTAELLDSLNRRVHIFIRHSK